MPDVKGYCAKCGRTLSQIKSDFDAVRRRGGVVIGDGTLLLYCDNCNKSFCGRCQVDNWNSCCPICGKALD
jgi:hypothetical protein